MRCLFPGARLILAPESGPGSRSQRGTVRVRHLCSSHARTTGEPSREGGTGAGNPPLPLRKNHVLRNCLLCLTSDTEE